VLDGLDGKLCLEQQRKQEVHDFQEMRVTFRVMRMKSKGSGFVRVMIGLGGVGMHGTRQVMEEVAGHHRVECLEVHNKILLFLQSTVGFHNDGIDGKLLHVCYPMTILLMGYGQSAIAMTVP